MVLVCLASSNPSFPVVYPYYFNQFQSTTFGFTVCKTCSAPKICSGLYLSVAPISRCCLRVMGGDKGTVGSFVDLPEKVPRE